MENSARMQTKNVLKNKITQRQTCCCRTRVRLRRGDAEGTQPVTVPAGACSRTAAKQRPPPMTTLFRGAFSTQEDLSQLLRVQSELCARAASLCVGSAGGKKSRREQDGVASHAAVAEIQCIIANVSTL